MVVNLHSKDCSFELNISGYEFDKPDRLSSNDWLNIRVRVSTGEVSWEAEDSCLTVGELNEFKDWIGFIAEGHEVPSRLSFLEHELAFMFHQNVLSIILDYNLHPNGCDYDYDTDREVILQFTLNSTQWQGLYDELSKLCGEYTNRN